MRSGVRLVTTRRSSGQVATRSATMEAASITCSRLSRSSNAFLSPMRAVTASSNLLPSASLTSRASARVGTTSDKSVTSARETNEMPSRNSGPSRRHTSMAVLVLPIPPGPVIVTTRCSETRSVRAARSASRPTRGGPGSGRLAGRVASCSPLPCRKSGAGTTSPSTAMA
jgi:hypothetical protein